MDEQSFSFTFDDAVLPGDIAHVRKMIAAAPMFSPEEIPVASALAEIRMGSKDPDYHFLFARDPDRSLLGYTCYGPAPLTDRRFNLYWVVVNPKAQRQGMGRKLIDETEKRIRAAGGMHIYVETPSSDTYIEARTFYMHHGYRQLTVLKDFFRDGDDKVIFRKILD